jgi:hypothetical protein
VRWISGDGDAEPGLLAFGAQPVGIIAIGSSPVGVIAIGVAARGFLAIGAIAIGAIAIACGAGGGGRVFVCGLGAGGVVSCLGSGFGLHVDGHGMLLGDYEPTVWWWTKALVLSGVLAALIVLVWYGRWPAGWP